jgi:uncharacterized protein
MKLEKNAALLRVFLGESDLHHGKPLYEEIVERARAKGLAGATVFRASMGFGAASRIHTTKILRLSEDLPVVVELVDAESKLKSFLRELDGIMGGGLATLEKATVHLYRPAARAPQAAKKSPKR